MIWDSETDEDGFGNFGDEWAPIEKLFNPEKLITTNLQVRFV